MNKKEFPQSLMSKFLKGIEEKEEINTDSWKSEIELRPSRLGLGADPSKGKKSENTLIEKKISNMIKNKNNQSSDEEEYRKYIKK